VSAVADRYAEFQALGVEVISVSVDSQFVHKVWNDTELSKMVDGGVPFHMASDGGGAIGTVYGVYSPAQGVDFGAASSSIRTESSREWKSSLLQ